ncbi:MAG TPA: hypothetical protein VN867_04860, partial [Candidatus Binataceae bacterium]|nr:hypothetical protein [Candidatus Binataceae bacterium]
MPEIEVTAMTFGPYAIARLDGAVVMVPNAAPGDRLEANIASRKRDFSIGAIERVMLPGPHRRVAPCPFLPRCGGCDWQHLDYVAQLRAKSELIAAGLRRVDVEVSAQNLVEPAPEEFGYRARIRLKVGRDGKLGFYQLGSNRLVEIDRCMVAAPGLRIPNGFANSLWKNLEEIEVVQNGQREVIAASMRKPPSAREIELAQQVFEQDAALQGIILRSGRTRKIIGDPAISISGEA